MIDIRSLQKNVLQENMRKLFFETDTIESFMKCPAGGFLVFCNLDRLPRKSRLYIQCTCFSAETIFTYSRIYSFNAG